MFFCHNTNHILTYDSIQAKYPAPYYRNELPHTPSATEAEALSADQSPPDPPSDKEFPTLAGPTILHLFHNLSSNSEPENSDYNDSDSYDYSVLAVPETVSVPYKLCSG
ncbi:hypothetical protein DSO57_1021354 [Entomophthora muscae]|uniref:Uncharacterized protein n=1 Tax=Entomophthora muscae TaxID=34485 RepID=A0ACC2TEM3_9FUNG|nr:hypothetical protein DSO57_1021354 [Entomophthora muscae]